MTMATIIEEHVSFKTAKLLKEKGFDEPCHCFYEYKKRLYNDMDKYFPNGMKNSDHNKEGNKGVSAPTQAIAIKWLREVYKLVITVSIGNENNKGNTDYSNPDRWFYFFDITNAKGVVIDTEYDPLSNEFPTYEAACEAAIKYCLENLI